MHTLFLGILKLSLMGTLLAVAVILLRLVFRKAPKWIIVLLWGVVALRLIIPFSIESDFFLMPDSVVSGKIIDNVSEKYTGEVDIIYYSDRSRFLEAVRAGCEPVWSEKGSYVLTEKGSLEEPRTIGNTVFLVLSWIWLAGTALMLGYAAVSYSLLKRRLEEAEPLRENIWQSERVDSPFVFGINDPQIYLPYAISSADMKNVIAHEKAHIRRWDDSWKPIGFFLLSIHWFNPVLWIAYILFCRDIEAACDEKVIKDMNLDERRAYSTALLNCSIYHSGVNACPLAFGEVAVKQRIKNVMKYKKATVWITLVAIVICAIASVGFFTTPKERVRVPVDGECEYIELIYCGHLDNSYIIDNKEECEELLTMVCNISAKEQGSTFGHSGGGFSLKIYQKGKNDPVIITLWSEQKFTIRGYTAKDGYESFFEADLTELLGYLREEYPKEFWYDGNGKALHRVNA